MKLRAPVLALASVAVIAGVIAAFFVVESKHHDAKSSSSSVLFSQSADGGTLKPAGGDRMTLVMRGVAPQLVWTEDRPDRDAGQLSVGDLVSGWAKLGFASDAPNAVLTLLDGADEADTIAIELLHRPRYNPTDQTVVYDVRRLRETSDGLGGFQDDLDRRVPERFDAASVFIDNAGAEQVHALEDQEPEATPAGRGASALPRQPAAPTGVPQQPAQTSGGMAPDWYPDPYEQANLRYFDGVNWTDQTAN